jgi:hypothetical protein
LQFGVLQTARLAFAGLLAGSAVFACLPQRGRRPLLEEPEWLDHEAGRLSDGPAAVAGRQLTPLSSLAAEAK